MKNPKEKKSEAIIAYESYTARVGKETIPCYTPSIGKEELALVTDVIERNWLSENKYTREFESKLAEICERKYAVCFGNATAALISGMKGLGLKTGDEIIVPSLSHSADPNSISATGATPVFADVDEETLCLSVKTIEVVRTARTKAILYVCAYGNTGALDTITRYAKKHKLFLINDSAPALFGTYKGKPIPSYGDFSVLSFFADKTITTGEGGMLLSDNTKLVSEANIYKHDGRRERGVDTIERRGYNFRITELQSAVGVAQLKKADYFVKRKKEILGIYRKKLSGVSGVRVFAFNSLADAVPHRAILFVPNAKKLIRHLETCGIGARTLFMPMHSQPAYGEKGHFPITEKLFKTGVCLPSAPNLKQEEIEYVCSEITNYYQTR
ncbi:MAG: DegT/DnrJ/EryC1/StrS family aminotransferase [bacterium]|nr:DegT/DnrJ/EryC1/StrS family aminotransferase [bacterium]